MSNLTHFKGHFCSTGKYVGVSLPLSNNQLSYPQACLEQVAVFGSNKKGCNQRRQTIVPILARSPKSTESGAPARLAAAALAALAALTPASALAISGGGGELVSLSCLQDTSEHLKVLPCMYMKYIILHCRHWNWCSPGFPRPFFEGLQGSKAVQG